MANGAGGTPNFETKTPEEILADVNEILRSVWVATGLCHHAQPDSAVSQRIMSALSIPIAPLSGVSILKYLQDNAICKIIDGKELEIVPVKWASELARLAPTGWWPTFLASITWPSIFSPMQQYGPWKCATSRSTSTIALRSAGCNSATRKNGLPRRPVRRRHASQSKISFHVEHPDGSGTVHFVRGQVYDIPDDSELLEALVRQGLHRAPASSPSRLASRRRPPANP